MNFIKFMGMVVVMIAMMGLINAGLMIILQLRLVRVKKEDEDAIERVHRIYLSSIDIQAFAAFITFLLLYLTFSGNLINSFSFFESDVGGFLAAAVLLLGLIGAAFSFGLEYQRRECNKNIELIHKSK